MHYGRSIQTLRKRRGLTQKELATLVGVDQSYISLLERNERVPNLDVLETISAHLEVPFMLLMVMASDDDDLRGITAEQAGELSAGLLALADQIVSRRGPDQQGQA